MKNPIPLLRTIAILEGISFLVLMGIAMPMKYIFHMPIAVQVVGWIHGILFTLLCIVLLRTMLLAKWPLSRAALVFIGALLPFGPFVLDRRLVAFQREFQRGQR